MFWRSHSSIPRLCSLALLLAPVATLAESTIAPPGAAASASLRFSVVVPPVVRVLENSHPSELLADGNGVLSGQQRLVVVSTMKHGFCVTLRLAQPKTTGWRMLNASEQGGISLEPQADGYRLCTARPGRYALLLQHEFGTAAPGVQTAMRWPVQTDLSTL